MARCETCGNDYDKTFDIALGGRNHTLDAFECAIHKLAPTCAHCSCRILGHGVGSRRGDLLLRSLRRRIGSARDQRSRLAIERLRPAKSSINPREPNNGSLYARRSAQDETTSCANNRC